MEGLQKNVQRLKEYKSKLILFPRKGINNKHSSSVSKYSIYSLNMHYGITSYVYIVYHQILYYFNCNAYIKIIR